MSPPGELAGKSRSCPLMVGQREPTATIQKIIILSSPFPAILLYNSQTLGLFVCKHMAR